MAESSAHDGPEASHVGSAPNAVAVLVAFLILLCLLPGRLVLPALGAAGRPASVMAVGLLGWWLLTRLLPDDRPPVAVPIRWALCAFLTAHLVAVIAGLDRGLPGIELRSMDRFVLVALGLSGLVLVCIDGLPTVESVQQVLGWAVALSAVGATAGILQFAGIIDVPGLVRVPGLRNHEDVEALAVRGALNFRRAEGFTLHSIEFGVVLGAMLPAALYMASVRRSRWWYAAAIAIGAAAPLTISRTATLSLIVGMGVWALGWNWRQRINAFVFVVGAAAVYTVITPRLLGTIRGLFLNIRNDNSTTARTEDYAAVADYIRDRPWFGRGPRTFLPGEYRLLDNAYLLAIIEAGFVGFLSLVSLLVVGCWTAYRLIRHSDDPEVPQLARALGAAVAVSLLGFATYDGLAYPTMLGVLGLSLGGLGALDRMERLRASIRSEAIATSSSELAR